MGIRVSRASVRSKQRIEARGTHGSCLSRLCWFAAHTFLNAGASTHLAAPYVACSLTLSQILPTRCGLENPTS